MKKIAAILIAACLPMTVLHAQRPSSFAEVLSSRPVYGEVRVPERQWDCEPEADLPPGTIPGCRAVPGWRMEQRVEGYDVLYRYAGRVYNTRLPYPPGERLPVAGRGRGPALGLQ